MKRSLRALGAPLALCMLCVLSALPLLAMGCTAIVSSRPPEIRCVVPDDGRDPCPEGLRCDESGRCVAEEVCNGLDDDRDGRVDEGHDVDMDGVTWCGPDEIDCDDTNAGIYPAHDGLASAGEVCDGADNDCDGMTDEGLCPGAEEECVPRLRACAVIDCTFPESARCPRGSICDTSLPVPECVTSPDACTDPGVTCDPGLVCDEQTGQCITPMAPGSACDRNVQCGGGSLCFSAEALAIEVADRGGKSGICAAACCQDSDCATGFTCWAPGTGSRACVPDALIASGPQGAADPAVCGNNAECASEVCTLEFGSGYYTPTLVVPACYPDPVVFGCDCSVSQPGCDSDPVLGVYCDRGLCFTRSGTADRCTEICRSDADCIASSNEGCLYINIRLTGAGGSPTGNAWLPMCEVRSTGGRSPHGASCVTSMECLDEACVGAEPGVDCRTEPCTCARTCCNDTQCTGGERCQPTLTDGIWEMHCRVP